MSTATPTLTAASGVTMTLRAVEAHGELEGLLFALTLRQRYVNPTQQVAEVTYTFPVAWGAWLLDLHVELGGQRLAGQVLPKRQAEARYEAAIDAGDAPAMLERSAEGLYTLNLGNLKPGEEAVIEVRTAQLLRFEQGVVRLAIPTTIAPRYGDAHAEGGLPAHAGVETSVTASYPLSLRLDVKGLPASATLSCPTHAMRREDGPGGVTFTLQDAFLDRDVVFTAEGLGALATSLVVPDGETWVAIASVCPPLPAPAPNRRPVKLLVDCSGSMGGDSIRSAREALAQVVEELEDGMAFTLSCFGSDIRHLVEQPLVADREARARVQGLIARIDADMGGTELDRALEATLALAAPEGGTDVLLVTDGEVWGDPRVNQLAQRTGHRIFAVGLGSAPNEVRLRQQAEATGGACELVTPNEDVAEAIVRMFRRMRQAPTSLGAVVWPATPLWEAPRPRVIFGGETLHLVAGFAAPPTGALTLTYGEGERLVAPLAAPDGEAGARGATPARLAAALRLPALDELAATALAVEHALVTRYTNMVAVHVRAEGEKTVGLPELIKVSQMHAAGSHGYGSAGIISYMRLDAAPIRDALQMKPDVMLRMAALNVDSAPFAIGDAPARPSRPPAPAAPAPVAPPAPGLFTRIKRALLGGGPVDHPLARLEAERDPAALRAWLAGTALEDAVPAIAPVVQALLAAGLAPEVARLVALLRWSEGPGCELSRRALRVVRAAVALCPPDEVARAEGLA
ncbi:MAG: VIT and VWA domain-containing protein [Candidatus Sericytochromatia bacterium]|nr:VIT and VWA domain-containing protein [Candidatus Sericytochromatia bacterium]